MNKIKGLLFGCTALFLAACSNEDLMEDAPVKSDVVEISAEIVPNKDSRIAIDQEGKGQFTENDAIQLFVNSEYNTSNYGLTLKNNIWEPQLTWNELQGNNPTFAAYYPALKSGNIWSVAYDQSKGNNFQNADLLTARTTVARGNKVNLEFQHALSRLTVKMTSNHYTEEDFRKASVQVWGFTQAKIDPLTGNFKNAEFAIKMKYMGNGVFQAIMIPQTVEYWQDGTTWMTVSVGNTYKEITAPARLDDASEFKALEPGKEMTMTLNFDKESAEKWSGQTHWVYGLNMPAINDPDTDPSGKWGWAYVDNTQKILGLTWDRSYGWYDCKKVNPTNPDDPAHDSNMCWAASCSNMIHWWLDRNADYVKLLGYEGKWTYPNSLKSNVFQLFKDNYENEGYFPENGLNWFFIGRDGANPKPNAGFFQKVFGNHSVVRVVDFLTNRPHKDEFNNALKEAFRRQECIECSFILPNGFAHAINVWGAEFDENGEACALYVVDNNHTDWEYGNIAPGTIPTGIYKHRIRYVGNDVMMESSTHGYFKQKISRLVFLGMHRDALEEYCVKNGLK